MKMQPVFESFSKSKLIGAVGDLLARLAAEVEVSGQDAKDILSPALGSGEADQLISDLFGDEDLSQFVVFKLWARLFPDGLDGADFEKLGKTLKELCKNSPPEIALTLLDAGVEINDVPNEHLDLMLKTRAKLALQVEGCAAPPASRENPDREPTLVRVGLDGTLAGMASLGVSFPPVSLSGETGLTAGSTVNLYLRASGSAILGNVALDGFLAFTRHSAFRVRSVIELLTSQATEGTLVARPEAFSHRANQAWRFKGKIGIGRNFELGGGNSVDLSVTAVDFSFQETGEFEYTMTLHPDGLRVDIRRMSRTESDIQKGLGVELDLTGATKGLFSALDDALGDTSKALNKLVELLPSENVIRNTLNDQLKKTLGDMPEKDQLLAVVGLDPSVTVEDRLAARLAELIARAPTLWNDKSRATAESIIDYALGQLDGLTPELRSELSSQLKGRVATALDQLDKALKDSVEDVVKTSTGYQRIKGALMALGDPISNQITALNSKVNKVVEKLRKHIKSYQEFISKLDTYLESAAARRIGLKRSSQRRETDSEEVTISLLFDPEAPKADDLLRRLLLGDVQEVFETAIAVQGSSPVRALNEASLTQYAGLKKERGFELVLFGFDIGGQSVIETETTIIEDMRGHLTVATKMSLAEILKSLSDKRRFNFVSAYELSNAKEIGAATIGFSASVESTGLDAAELEELVRGVDILGMLSRGSMAALNDAINQAQDVEFAHSRINLGITLSKAQLETLIERAKPVASIGIKPDDAVPKLCQTSSVSPSNSSTFQLLQNRAVAYEAFDRVLKVVDVTEPDLDLRKRLVKAAELPIEDWPVSRMIKEWRTLRNNIHITDLDNDLDRALDWLKFRKKGINKVAGIALLGIWGIYHSGPFGWTNERYQNCQEGVGDALATWFDRSGSQGWAFGLRAELRPVTLALMLTLLELSDPDSQSPGPYLSIDLQVLDDDGKVIKTLTVAA